jgi:hypothetical protein
VTREEFEWWRKSVDWVRIMALGKLHKQDEEEEYKKILYEQIVMGMIGCKKYF